MLYRAAFLILLSGCVGKRKYNAAIDALNAANAQLESQEARLNSLETSLAAAGQDRARLEADMTEQERALREMAARQAEAQARIAEFRDLVARFQELIDAGTLQVKIVDGRMVVQMATDILFASGSAKLSEGGQTAVRQVAQVLATIPDKEFQIEGHTDNVPIKTSQYPSNWELASDRAMTVMRTMIEAGLPAHRVSAASFSEYHPVANNTTDTGRQQNRRIEIVVVPDLSGLPGFDELNQVATGPR